ncbi:MAG: alpha/beta fold hydrolase, partial [Rhodospirillales bacterium]|nr:alpha/beta fold hydrolase [Rhodospirillales bacterium]
MSAPILNERSDLPGPLRRRGPRPLLLHLTLAMLRSSASIATSGIWNPDSPPWKDGSTPHGAAWAALWASAAGAAPAAAGADPGFTGAVMAEAMRQDAALVAGIAAYRRHPYARDLQDPPALWREGDSRLLDYATGGTGPAVLFVPSLVNRAYVLDLAPGRSMLRWLAGQGFRPMLLDWGWPGPAERGFTLTDYIAGRLERALAAAVEGPVVLAGYCMGGLLALAAALRRPDMVRGLALLATPWDFHAAGDGAGERIAGLVSLLEPALALHAALPIDALQMLFALLDPFGVAEKYRAFARLDQAGARAELFVALE